MKIKPRGHWLVIKTIDASKVGDLWVPDSSKAAYKKGSIVEVPADPADEAKGLAVGDIVVFESVGAVDIRFGSSTFVMLKGREVIGTVTEDEA